jgi:hypothetical protein
MPKNRVTDLITDQEMVFARLVLSGTMTDRRAAEAAGLNPDTAAYTKSKPRVRAYMLEHSAAVRERLVEEDADLSRRAVDQQRRLHQSRDRLLARLWEIADLDPEKTRGSLSGQVKALSLIAAIEGLIPDRRAVPAQNKPAPPPVTADIYAAAWLNQQQENMGSPPDPAQPEATPEPLKLSSRLSRRAAEPERSAAEGPTVDVIASTSSAGHLSPSQTAPSALRVPGADFVSVARAPFSIRKGPFARRR